jgi:hypothetical protein
VEQDPIGVKFLIVFGFQKVLKSNKFNITMAKCSVLKLLGAWLLTLASCSNGGREFAKSSEKSSSRPSIYDAWDARYDYDANARRMVPLYKGRVVGKSWARDSEGQLSAASYTGRSKELDEDLFPLHLSKRNRERDKNWEMNKQKRMEVVREMLQVLEDDKKEPLVEVLIEDEEEEFVPPAFIPSGIELNDNTGSPPLNPIESKADGGDELSPFPPLP